MSYSIFDDIPKLDGCSSSQLKFLIQRFIEHFIFEDALLLSELLYERVKTDENLVILCDCLLKLSRADEVYNLLKPLPKDHPSIRYIFAKCCFDLKKYEECEHVLFNENLELHPSLAGSPTSPFARLLLCNVLIETGRIEHSLEECAKSVRENPFSWSSITSYIRVGGRKISELVADNDSRGRIIENEPLLDTPEEEKSVTPVILCPVPKVGICAPKKSRVSEIAETRRSSRLVNQDRENVVNATARVSVQPRTGKLRNFTRSELTPTVIGTRSERTSTSRKSRDAKQPLASRSSNAMRSLSSSSTSVASISTISTSDKEPADDLSKRGNPLSPLTRDVYDSLKVLAAIEEAVCTYKWTEAGNLLGSLPNIVKEHAVTLHLCARMKFEQAEYAAARDIIQRQRQKYPHRLEGTELLSTALWHLQDNYRLSQLAQELCTKARKRPQTWCVAGNCFSLQRQHALAVECMERAILLDPHFAYAYTLLGHELVFQEELDKAAKAFRTALSISPNDYRAWYGLGQVHQRTEQLSLAQNSMAQALKINPNSRAILCTLAQVEQALNRPAKAMELLNTALELNPNDVACRYNRARLLYETKQYDKCVEELNELKGLSPDEAYIFHLLGKVHRRLGNTHLALLNYSWATEMDPRGEQMLAHGAGGENPYDDETYSPEAD
ncbi:unnamed protein product [Auanema sp. JU1783]|nr:unnamed protein product [Auanema sp. JU1783]